MVENESRWNWQFPTFITIDEWQVDKSALVDSLLIVGNSVDEAELARDLIACIAEKRKAQLVLIVHEERLLHGLRRDCDEGCAGLLEFRHDQVHSFHLAHAKGAPASANDADHELAVVQKFGGANRLAIVVLELEIWSSLAGGKSTLSKAGGSEFGDDPRVDVA